MRGLEHVPALYDSVMALFEAAGLLRWRKWLVGGASGRVLDLGCGTGRNLPLFPATTVVVGVDPSADALRRAQSRAPGVHLVRARAEALPFRPDAFDTATCGLVLCSVDDPPAALRELGRVLRPGGQLRAMEHVRARPAWQARVQDVLEPAWRRASGGCRLNRDTERVLADTGFIIEPRSRRAVGILRRFVARPKALEGRREPDNN